MLLCCIINVVSPSPPPKDRYPHIPPPNISNPQPISQIPHALLCPSTSMVPPSANGNPQRRRTARGRVRPPGHLRVSQRGHARRYEKRPSALPRKTFKRPARKLRRGGFVLAFRRPTMPIRQCAVSPPCAECKRLASRSRGYFQNKPHPARGSESESEPTGYPLSRISPRDSPQLTLAHPARCSSTGFPPLNSHTIRSPTEPDWINVRSLTEYLPCVCFLYGARG